jgi:hypothetical protein
VTTVAETKPKRRRATAKPAAKGVAPALSSALIRGLEVVQSVQSLDNDVVLIAGKPTMVRVYLDPAQASAGTRLAGELTWRRGGGGMSYLPSSNVLQLSAPAPTLLAQRLDLSLSLNFVLPQDAVRAGWLELLLNRVYAPGAGDVSGSPTALGRYVFETAPVLRVRAIGLRYESRADPGKRVAPDAIHFAHMKSYLLRAYPIAELDWSQIVVDATPALRPPFGDSASDIANGQLALMRRLDLSAGRHPRTHYYGLVDDDLRREFMRGSAVLSRAVFEMIASGPAGRPDGFAGDFDKSYADWYSAHELGHTFQRRHPGFPPHRQPRDPADLPGYPYKDGLISPPQDEYVGLDMGDAALGLPCQALRGTQHHDFMTYAPDQWVCDYTYNGVLEQLRAEVADFGD